jgi:L-asparaginase
VDPGGGEEGLTSLPRLSLIATGGTIDSLGTDRLDLAWYIEAEKRLPEGALLDLVPEAREIATITELPFRRLSSHALVDRDWLALHHKIEGEFAADRADGIVLTHGTNTLEETAYFLHLTVKSDRPVVLVGAMRPASGASTDAVLNLIDAVRTAASPSSRGRGVLVVLNGTVHGARDVTKTATFRLEAFRSPDAGPLGVADADGSVVYAHRPERPHTAATEFDVAALASLPRVDVVTSYVGADGAMIDAAVAAGARGIVSAGTGAGRPTPLEDEALTRARERGVVVCQSTRVGSGRVVASPALRKRGLVAAGDLQPWKARVLLALALTRTQDPVEIQRMFDTY